MHTPTCTHATVSGGAEGGEDGAAEGLVVEPCEQRAAGEVQEVAGDG